MGGLVPLTWMEVAAFRGETGRVLPGWETETLMEMSRAYVVEAGKATNPLRIAPVDRGKPKEAYDLAADGSGQ